MMMSAKSLVTVTTLVACIALASRAGAGTGTGTGTGTAASVAGGGTVEHDPLAATGDLATEDEGDARRFTLEISPMSFFLARYGAEATVVPIDHHALTGTLYYYDATTEIQQIPGNSAPCPCGGPNHFRGVGGEIGYRWYSGARGPRGVFAGPSLLLGRFDAIPTYGDKTSFYDLGLAIDVGYEALIGDDFVILVGAGAQYVKPSESLPQQTTYVAAVANAAFRPRALLAFGWAF
jgi:hypothetical protein